jgi:DinB superfamily
MVGPEEPRDALQDLFQLSGRRPRGGAPGEHPGEVLVPQLQDLESEFREIGRQLRTVADGLSHEQLNWRPGSGQWSIAECLGHLNMMGSEPLEAIDAGIREARTKQWYSQGPFRIGFFADRLVRATEPPARWKQEARRKFVPPSDQPFAAVVPAVIDLQEQLIARLRLANGLNLGRIKILAPGRPFLRLNLYELFVFIAAHERRHLEQAVRTRRDRMLPKSGPARPGGSPQRA